MKIPKNIIRENQYTIGNEFIYENSYKEYQGYYYELNNKFFAGKEFNVNAPILIKKNSNEVNKLLLNPKTSEYAKLSNNKIKNYKSFSFYFIPTEQDAKEGQTIRYFCQQVNTKLIKEINKKDYQDIFSNSLFITVGIKCYIIADILNPIGDNNYIFDNIDLENAQKVIPEIKTFLEG
jgi:hypothetical protein